MPSDKTSVIHSRKLFGSLSSTLSVWFLILSLGPVVIIGLNEYYKGREAIEASRYEQLTTINDLLSQQINDHFDLLVRSLYDKADSASAFIQQVQDLIQHEGANGKALSESAGYQQMVDHYATDFISFVRLHDYSNLLLLDTEGHILYTASSYGELGLNLFSSELADTAFSKAAKQAFQSGMPTYADVGEYPPIGKALVSFFIIPLHSDTGTIKGLLAAQLSVSAVQNFFDDLDSGSRGVKSYLLGRDQKVRYGTELDSRRVMKNRLEGELVKEWLSHLEEGIGFDEHEEEAVIGSDYLQVDSHDANHIKSYYNYDNELVLGTYHPIEIAGTELALISEVSREKAFSSIHHFRNRILLLAIIIVAAVFVLSILVSRWLVKPIVKVAHSVNRVAAGDYHATQVIKKNNEIGWLSQCVHEMTEQLREQQSALEKANDELQISNSVLAEKSEQLLFRKEEIEHKNSEIEESSYRLKEKAEELEKASRYKSEFLANISHELRTPLNSMIILAQMLRENEEGNLSSDQMESIEVIHKGSEELLELINDILDLSKVEAGKMSVDFNPVPIRELCKNIIDLFKPQADQKKLLLTNDIDSAVNELIVTDALRLQQILKNFLSNAFKFTASGSVKLSVKCDCRTGREFVIFSVEDTGIGISKEQQERIFDAFQQGDGSTSRKYGGTGLGLTISRELAVLLEGSIELESESGKGTCFRLRLPANGPSGFNWEGVDYVLSAASERVQISVLTEVWDQPQIIDIDKKQHQTESQLKNRQEQISDTPVRILVVDDRPENLLVMDKLLSEFGVEVCKADSGEKALVEVSKQRFAVILMDVQMPGMDGFETAETIHANPETASTPIIFVTALHRDKLYIKKGYQTGAVDYLSKPIDPEILKGKVKVFVELERQRLQLESVSEQLEVSSRKNKHLLDSAGEGILGIQQDGLISFANPLAEQLLGVERDSLAGQCIHIFVFGENSSKQDWVDSAMKKICFDRGEKYTTDAHRLWAKGQGSFPAEYSLTPVADEQGVVEGAVLLFQDITERKQAEHQLNHMARYDELTGLANRALFQEYLEASLGRSKRRSKCTGLLFLDLDGFKQINDSLGHDAGDQLLISVAARLKEVVRQGDLVARLGGDEFAVILDDIADSGDIRLVADKILHTMTPPHELTEQQETVGVSVGIATTDDVGLEADTLLKAADTAMYEVKKSGKNGYRLYSEIKGNQGMDNHEK